MSNIANSEKINKIKLNIKILSTSIFLLLWFFITSSDQIVWATSPFIGQLSSQERKQIEQLRFNPKDDVLQTEQKFMTNAARECSGYGYHADDMDLTVEQIQKTYPESLINQLTQKNLLSFCPYYIQAQAENLPLTEGKNLLQQYILKTEKLNETSIAGNYWNIIKPMASLLGEKCSPEDFEAFQRLYCFYAKFDASLSVHHSSFIDFLKQDFFNACPSAQTAVPLIELCDDISFSTLADNMNSKGSDTANPDLLKDEKFSNNFGCATDTDCHATKSGTCITGKILYDALKDQIPTNPKHKCRCVKGPVVYGCVIEEN